MSPLAFVVRVSPLYGLALVFTGIGAILLSARVPSTWLMSAAILVLLAFAALMTFRRAQGWSSILLLTFALLAGILLGLMLPGSRLQWPWALVGSVGVPLVGIPLGWLWGARLRAFAWGAWIAAWVYILGWIPWQWLMKEALTRMPWGIAGLIVFSALVAAWSASLPERPPNEPDGSIASELYLIGLNLGLAALIVAGG